MIPDSQTTVHRTMAPISKMLRKSTVTLFRTCATKIQREEIKCAGDMSIQGLCVDSIVAAIKNNMTQSATPEPKDSPLGRWKTGVDNHDKSYAYDHSA